MKFQIKHLNSKWFHLIFLFHFGFAAEIEFPNDSLLNSKIMNESGDTLTVSNITNDETIHYLLLGLLGVALVKLI